jgi:ABC-type Fe3+-hydroxamate transport system substrate-binding protein
VIVNDFNRPEVVYLMERAGLRVHRQRYPRSIQDVTENLRQLGLALDEEDKASRWIREIEETLTQARRRLAGRARVPVLLLSGGLYAQGDDCLADELIREAGGENVLRGGSRTVSPEEIVFLNPQVVVLSEDGMNVFRTDPALSKLECRIQVMPWRDAQPPTQYAGRAIRKWAALLHPELFGDWK